MTEQNKIDELHERVTQWSERFKAEGKGPDDMMTDPEFQGLMGELMEQDMDTLMVLLGKAAQEAGTDETFDLLGDTYTNDDK